MLDYPEQDKLRRPGTAPYRIRRNDGAARLHVVGVYKNEALP